MITLAGGWGYENLGDEAILAGYLEFLGSETQLQVISVDPEKTRRAQRLPARYQAESLSRLRVEDLLLCGGGYLNGSWVPEIYKKLLRLSRLEPAGRSVVHAVEVRGFDGAVLPKMFRSNFHESVISVRDEASVVTVSQACNITPSIVPDAIALLFPSLHKFVQKMDSLQGKVLLNLLDISKRSDALESELDLGAWYQFISELIERLGDRAVGLVIGEGDYAFMRRFPTLGICEPKTVEEMVSAIDSADALFSVRMHPSLIASGLGKPVVSVPYCGKVRPTLSRLGLGHQILDVLDVSAVHSIWQNNPDVSSSWERAFMETSSWLSRELDL